MLKKGICGVVLGCALASGIGLVNAELNGSSKSVKIGNVDTPIYSYEIDMDDFGLYDWVYNNETSEYEWLNGCSEYTYEAGMGTSDGMYSDSKCSVNVGSLEDGDTYYMRKSNSITIVDNSTLGKISADVVYTPSENYKWTGMEIVSQIAKCEIIEVDNGLGPDFNGGYLYVDDECSSTYIDTYGEDYVYDYENNVAYTYTYAYDSTSNGNTTVSSYPSQYTKDVNFIEKNLNFSYVGGGVGYETETREAEFSLTPFIININDNDISTPVAGETLGTVTINIHESL